MMRLDGIKQYVLKLVAPARLTDFIIVGRGGKNRGVLSLSDVKVLILSLEGSGITEELTAAVDLAAGDLCFVDGDGKLDKADASAEATSDTLLVIATETIAADAVGTFLLFGQFITTGLTQGANHFVSLTAGEITATAPSVAGEIIRNVGTALSTTVLFFNPSISFLEVA